MQNLFKYGLPLNPHDLKHAKPLIYWEKRETHSLIQRLVKINLEEEEEMFSSSSLSLFSSLPQLIFFSLPLSLSPYMHKRQRWFPTFPQLVRNFRHIFYRNLIQNMHSSSKASPHNFMESVE